MKVRCIITTPDGLSVTSDYAVLTYRTDGPKITKQPSSTSITVWANDTASTSISATGKNLKYQWQKQDIRTGEWKTFGRCLTELRAREIAEQK